MMRFFIIVKIILLNIIPLSGQDEILLSLEYDYFRKDKDSLRDRFLLRKADHYLSTGDVQGQLREYKRIREDYLPQSEKDRYLWNAALAGFLNNDLNFARSRFSSYMQATSDTSVFAGVLNALIEQGSGESIQGLLARDSSLACLSCIYKVRTSEFRGKNAYLISSALLPGSGSILLGYPIKGVFSLALSAGSAFGVIAMVRETLYLNAFLWGTGLGLKFYVGNIKLTGRLFEARAEKKRKTMRTKCAEKMQEALSRYPLSFRH